MASLLFIEGNVGAGKTTVVKELYDRGFSVAYEPTEIWTEHISRVYHDKKWSLPMHYLALSTHVERILQALRIARKHDTIVVVERSFSSVDIFAKCDNDIGEGHEYWEIHQWYRSLLEEELRGIPIHAMYLKTNPLECLKRIGIRGRLGEDALGLDYLNKLHNFHEEQFASDNTIVVNSTIPLEDVMDLITKEISNL